MGKVREGKQGRAVVATWATRRDQGESWRRKSVPPLTHIADVTTESRIGSPRWTSEMQPQRQRCSTAKRRRNVSTLFPNVTGVSTSYGNILQRWGSKEG